MSYRQGILASLSLLFHARMRDTRGATRFRIAV